MASTRALVPSGVEYRMYVWCRGVSESTKLQAAQEYNFLSEMMIGVLVLKVYSQRSSQVDAGRPSTICKDILS